MYISWLAQTLQHSKLLNSHDIHIQPNLRRLDDNIHCVSKNRTATIFLPVHNIYYVILL